MTARRFESILLTGASGGLGAALARRLAAPGVRLALGGRDPVRLEAAAAACRAAGAEAAPAPVDVTDREATAAWVLAEDARRPLDLVVACAGLSGETGAPGEDTDRAILIYRVNLLGLLHTVEPLIPLMRRRGRGQIGLIASVAGMRGISRGPAYSGSKAAVIAQGLAWREALAPDGVGVTVACPGYIRTAMTARHRFRLPFVLEPDEAARRIAAALRADRGRLVFPWPLAIAGWLFRALPAPLTRPLIPGPRRE